MTLPAPPSKTENLSAYRAYFRRRQNGTPLNGWGVATCAVCETAFQKKSRRNIYCSKKCQMGVRIKRAAVYNAAIRATQKWRSSSPEAFIRSLLSFYKRRETLSVDYMLSIWHAQNGLCALSGERLTHRLGEGHVGTNASIDKINPDGGYVPGNVRFVCRDVNSMRQRLSDDQLLEWCHKVINHMQKVKQ